MKRTSFAVMLAILFALTQPVAAQGQGQGHGQGQGNGSGSSENGGGQGGGNGQGQNGNAGGASNGQNGNAFGNNGPNVRGEGQVNMPPRGGTELSESEALAAVEAGRAVELAAILPDVRSRTGGEVINAQLQQVGAFLIYAVTVLTPSGKVLTEHYYARSGVYVGR